MSIGRSSSYMQREPRTYLASITGARRIVDFRNRLTHEYPTADDELVWWLVKVDLQVLRSECEALLSQLDSAD